MLLWHHTKKISSHIGKKTGHFFFPYIWHYYTDTYKDKLHHLVVDSVLSLILMSLLAVNVGLFSWLYLFSIPPDVRVTVTVPPVIISGEQLPITIVTQNFSKSVANYKIEVYAPQGFVYDENYTRAVTWATLPAAAEEETIIKGRFTGQVQTNNRVVVLYSYDYYGQHFSQLADATFAIGTSSLEVVPTIPDHILNNDEFTWTVDYSNSSDYARSHTCIDLVIPASFIVTASSHELKDGHIVEFETLEPRAQGTISITGSFNNALGEGSHVIAVRSIDQCDQLNTYVQTTNQTSIQVLTPRLQLATGGASIVNVGETVRYTNTYINTGDVALEDITVQTNLNTVSSKASRITPLDGGSISGNSIIWSGLSLGAGESRTVSFLVTISSGLREKNVEYSYSTSATGVVSDIAVPIYARAVSSGSKLNSTLQFATVNRYTTSSGEQLGYGPYPLEANQYTALRLFWEVKDFTNDLSNVTIQTTLPSQVEWTGHFAVSHGTAMTYDPATRTVTWHTGHIPSFSFPQGANFEVRVRPNTLQIGKQINITNETYFSARDSFTGVVLKRAAGASRTVQAIQPSGE